MEFPEGWKGEEFGKKPFLRRAGDTMRKKMAAVHFTTLRTKLSPLRHMERYGLMAVVPTLTALLLTSLNDLQFFIVCLYALLEFLHTMHYR